LLLPHQPFKIFRSAPTGAFFVILRFNIYSFVR
jgi:hypothetical protein